MILPYPGPSISLGAPQGNGTADSETTGEIPPHPRSYSPGRRMRSYDASQMAAPQDRHSPSPARKWPRSRPAAREQPPPRRTVRGRALLKDVICRATVSAVTCTIEQPAPKESRA